MLYLTINRAGIWRWPTFRWACRRSNDRDDGCHSGGRYPGGRRREGYRRRGRGGYRDRGHVNQPSDSARNQKCMVKQSTAMVVKKVIHHSSMCCFGSLSFVSTKLTILNNNCLLSILSIKQVLTTKIRKVNIYLNYKATLARFYRFIDSFKHLHEYCIPISIVYFTRITPLLFDMLLFAFNICADEDALHNIAFFL